MDSGAAQPAIGMPANPGHDPRVSRATGWLELHLRPSRSLPSIDLTALVHLAGFTTGIVLYAMLAVMTLRHARSDRTREAINRIPLAASLLGLLWNVGALVIYSQQDFGLGTPSPAVVALSFVALGFLPAVVVDSTTRPVVVSSQRALVLASYALSVVAGGMQIVGAAHGAVPSRLALVTLTVGYAIVLLLLAIATRHRDGWQRSLSTVALAAFAVSALHLSHDTGRADSPLAALFGHQASLPLVLVILYQDYRFAFADLFLRRAISLLVLVGIAFGLHVWVALPLATALGSGQNESLAANGVHVAFWVATALIYPFIQRGVRWFVNGVILGRLDYRRVRDEITNAASRGDTADDILASTCALLGPAVGARAIQARADDSAPLASAGTVERPAGSREAPDHVRVHIPTNDPPRYIIQIDGLRGGRRLLSDDVALLDSVASIVGRRIDAVRVTQERFDRGLREREIMRLAAEAELRALRAQLNPHFLFNALTTIGYLLQSAPERALGTLYKLTDLLRAVLRRPAGEAITLAEEIELIESYLAIERERFEERLLVQIDVPEELRSISVLPLLIQPLVENAVKHGISPLKRGGTVSVSASMDIGDDGERPTHALRVTVTDTGTGLADVTIGGGKKGEGVGLRSIEQRIALHYGASATLTVTNAAGRGTRAELRLPVTREAAVGTPAVRRPATRPAPTRSVV
jgi:anti-sigma regulatory factor (Ser/Thr protein kinase)